MTLSIEQYLGAVKRTVGVLSLACLATVVSARADDPAPDPSPDLTGLSIDQLLAIDVVYGASKYEQKVNRAPSSISIVTADQIRAFGYQTLADILASVQGFYSTSDRDYSYIGVRGFQRPGDYNLRILLLMDGHRINDNTYASALMGTESILNVDDIDRVEVIRGPSSSIYGTGAFFGVVNVVTRSGRDLRGFELSGGGGSYDSKGARVAYGKDLANGGEIFLSGSAYHSGGQNLFYKEFDNPATNNGLAVNCDEDGFYKFLAKASFGPLTVEAAHSTRDKGIPTAPYLTVFDDPRNRTTDRRTFLDLKYAPQFGPRTNLLGRLYYDQYYYQGKYLYGPPLDPPPENLYVERAYAYTYGTEVQLTSRPSQNNTLVAGGEFRDHTRQDYYAFDATGLYGVYSDLRRTSTDWALYIQDEYAPAKRLLLNLGVRYDEAPAFGGSANPRFALIYAPNEPTTLKFLAGGAFRTPSVYELYYGAAANPDLKPEQITTYEVVLERSLGTATRLSGSVFRNTIDDLISFDTATSLFQNIQRVDSDGVELETETRWKGGWALRADYALEEVTDRADHNRLTDSPRHLAKLHLLMPLAGEKLSAGAELQYTSDRLTLAGSEIGGFTVVNLSFLSGNLAPGLDLSAGVYNLLDKQYVDPGSRGNTQDTIAQNGRNFRIKLTWRF